MVAAIAGKKCGNQMETKKISKDCSWQVRSDSDRKDRVKTCQQVLSNGNTIATTLLLTATQIDQALLIGQLFYYCKKVEADKIEFSGYFKRKY